MPAQVIIAKDGFARYAHYRNSISDIHPNVEILEILRELNQSKTYATLSDVLAYKEVTEVIILRFIFMKN
jgi:hypothetical protein